MAATSQYRPVWTPAREYPAEPAKSAPARTVRRIATLERNSPRLVKIAARAGVDITYLGIAELFAEPRAYYLSCASVSLVSQRPPGLAGRRLVHARG
jgi:hypothetical protein